MPNDARPATQIVFHTRRKLRIKNKLCGGSNGGVDLVDVLVDVLVVVLRKEGRAHTVTHTV